MFTQENEMATTQQQFAPQYSTANLVIRITSADQLKASLTALESTIEQYSQSCSASLSVPCLSGE
jgi:hypothetical protein